MRARAAGVRFGRPPVPSGCLEKVRVALREGQGVRQAARSAGISLGKISRIKAEMVAAKRRGPAGYLCCGDRWHAHRWQKLRRVRRLSPYAPHLPRNKVTQLRATERLPQEGPTQAYLIDKPRNKNYPQVGVAANRLFGQRNTGHVRHTDVADHQAQGGMSVEQDEGLSAALRLKDPVPGVNQGVLRARSSELQQRRPAIHSACRFLPAARAKGGRWNGRCWWPWRHRRAVAGHETPPGWRYAPVARRMRERRRWTRFQLVQKVSIGWCSVRTRPRSPTGNGVSGGSPETPSPGSPRPLPW
jgi:hypothetical protein